MKIDSMTFVLKEKSKNAILNGFERLGFNITRIKFPVEASQTDIDIINNVTPFTMTSMLKLWALISSVKYIKENQLPGDFVECGVWRGGSSMAIANKLLAMGEMNRELYLFDTYSGMTSPTDVDEYNGVSAANILKSIEGANCFSSLDEVKQNMNRTNYPEHHINYIVGDVLETLQNESNLPEKIALLRLDTDWYESTKKELEVLYPRVVSGGVIIIDDYGHWQGARRAVDEFIQENNLKMQVHYIDSIGRLFYKP